MHSHWIHDVSFQRIFGIMSPLIGLPFNNIANIVVQKIQIRRARKSHVVPAGTCITTLSYSAMALISLLGSWLMISHTWWMNLAILITPECLEYSFLLSTFLPETSSSFLTLNLKKLVTLKKKLLVSESLWVVASATSTVFFFHFLCHINALDICNRKMRI